MDITAEMRQQVDEAAVRYRNSETGRKKIEDRQEREGKKVVDTPEQVEARFERLTGRPAQAELRTAPEHGPDAGHRKLERIINEKNDLQSVSFLVRGVRAVRSVARISVRDGDRRLPAGTGFLVSPRVLMTNNHVLPDASAAARAFAEFNYQIDEHDIEGPVARVDLDAGALFITDSHLDFTLVAVSPHSDGKPPGDTFGWNALQALQGKIIIGESLNVVGHPMGRLKEITIRDGSLQFQDDDFLQYTTDTEPGNSGSPVFNDQWEVVALHHAGVPSTNDQGDWLKQDGTPVQPGDRDDAVHWIANEGARVSVMLGHLHDHPVDAPGQPLLDEVLANSGLGDTAAVEAAALSGGLAALSERVTPEDPGRTGLRAAGEHHGDTHLVFIHGRGQQGKDPRQLRRMWTAGLGKGLLLADLQAIDADRSSFPFYGDVLAGQLHASESIPLTGPLSVAEALAPTRDDARGTYEDLLTEAADKTGYPTDGDADEGLFDGVLGRLQRRLGWLANRSRLDEVVIAAIFRDVAAYLSDDTLRDAVLDAVLADVPTSGKTVIVSHSLGTVVAMDLVTRLPDAVDVALFVTAGSPLGMDTVSSRTHTAGPRRPDKVTDWVNVWSPADPIAIGCPLVDAWDTPLTELITDNPTEHAHAIDEYLADVRVATAIGSTL